MADAPNPVIVGWLMQYTDARNTPHTAAFGFPASITIDQIAEQVGIQVYLWHDAETAREVFGGVQHSPIFSKSYTIPKANFPAYAAEPVVNGTVGGAIFAVCAQVAMTTQDTPTGAVDGQGQPVLASFFASATMQTLDLVTGALTPYPGG